MTRRNRLLGATAMPDIGAEAPKIEDDLSGARKPLEAIQGGGVSETGTASEAEKATKATATRKARKSKPKASIQLEPPEETYKPEPFKPGPLAEELDEDEAEFRAMRRDMDGVKGTSAAGIVSINAGKAPPKNEFFRTHPSFAPSVPIINIEKGMEKHFFAVSPNMVEPLAAIGITVAYHTLYFTITSDRTFTVVPVRDDSEGTEATNDYDGTKAIAMRRGRKDWVRMYTDMANRCYKVFPADEGRFSDPSWPDLTHAKIFRLAFRDKGRLIDSVDHPLFQKWASKDKPSPK